VGRWGRNDRPSWRATGKQKVGIDEAPMLDERVEMVGRDKWILLARSCVMPAFLLVGKWQQKHGILLCDSPSVCWFSLTRFRVRSGPPLSLYLLGFCPSLFYLHPPPPIIIALHRFSTSSDTVPSALTIRASVSQRQRRHLQHRAHRIRWFTTVSHSCVRTLFQHHQQNDRKTITRHHLLPPDPADAKVHDPSLYTKPCTHSWDGRGT